MAIGCPILQFGTGRFLQAHVDLFVSEAAAGGDALGGIAVVQSTSSPRSTARTQALARAQGYEVVVRGLVGGQVVQRRTTCHAVRAALVASQHWPQVRRLARDEVSVIVSNTGDAGWELHEADGADRLDPVAPAPASFPAKLLVLLHDRWRTQPEAPLTLLPCELVTRNGERLLGIVLALARGWQCPPPFMAWLQAHVVWANSLVDRIVSEAIEPVGAVAEPYALWAIEAQPRLQLPCRHPAIVLTDELSAFERRKLFLLNLAHTLLAESWLAGDRAPDMTVLQAMQAAPSRAALEAAWRDEVLPWFDATGEGAQARAYLDQVRDRLLNPFLAHRLADIAQHHPQKKARRIEPVVAWAREHMPSLAQPHLRAALSSGLCLGP